MQKVRIAVVGCGVMAGIWLEYVTSRDDCEIVSLTDLHTEATQKLARRFGLDCKHYTDACDAIADQPDILFDLTVPSAHCSVTSAALRAGIDVFGEKPISDDFAQARSMVALAKEKGRFYVIMQNRRYLRQLRDMRAFLDTGRIGRPQIVTADFFVAPHFGGFRDQMAHPLMIEMAIHTFDQYRYLTGVTPISVFCHEFNPGSSWFQGHCAALCTFEAADGCVFSYRGCWCAEGIPTSWQSQWRVVGEDGTLLWDGFGEPKCGVPVGEPDAQRYIRRCAPVDITRCYHGKEEYAGCLEEMFTARMECRKAETDCADNLLSDAMTFAALQSAQEQRKVLLAEWMEG